MADNVYKFQCSPRTFSRLEDEKYRSSLLEECKENLGSEFHANDKIIFTKYVTAQIDRVPLSETMQCSPASPKNFSAYMHQNSTVSSGYEWSPESPKNLGGNTCTQQNATVLSGYQSSPESSKNLSGNTCTQQNDTVLIEDDTDQLLRECEELLEEDSQEQSFGSTKNLWLDPPTKLFLSLVQEYQKHVGKKIELSNKSKMWKLISKKMMEKGYTFTDSQVKAKYHSMERQYKRVRLNNSKTGRNRMSCEYESELNALFGKKRGVFPDYTLHNATLEGVSRTELIDASGMTPDKECVTEDSNSAIKPRRKTTREILKEKMDEAAIDRSIFRDNVLTFLKEKEERAQQRFEDAERKKEERAEKKFLLMEKLIEKLCK